MSGKKVVSSASLIDQKRSAETRLDELRQAQVDALELGEEFEHNNEILLINEHLAALDKAIVRAQRREQREADERATLQARQLASTLIESIRSIEEERLAALDKAQQSFDLAVSSIFDFLQICGTQQLICQDAVDLFNSQPQNRRRIKGMVYTPGDRDIHELTESAVKARIGNYMADALRAFNDAAGNGRMGDVTWSGRRILERRWTEEERSAVEGRIERDLAMNMAYIAKSIPVPTDAEAE